MSKLPIEMKSLSSSTSLIKSSVSNMAPPTVFRISCTTSSLFGTYDGGFNFKYLVSASSPSHRIVLLPGNGYVSCKLQRYTNAAGLRMCLYPSRLSCPYRQNRVLETSLLSLDSLSSSLVLRKVAAWLIWKSNNWQVCYLYLAQEAVLVGWDGC